MGDGKDMTPADVANDLSEKDLSGKIPRLIALQTIEEKYADITLRLVEQYGDTVEPLTPEKERKLKYKLYLHVVLLILVINLVLFVSFLRFLETYAHADMPRLIKPPYLMHLYWASLRRPVSLAPSTTT